VSKWRAHAFAHTCMIHTRKHVRCTGFDTHVVKTAVDRFIKGCKSLMLEYESGCKEMAARAIMEWSLHELAAVGLCLRLLLC